VLAPPEFISLTHLLPRTSSSCDHQLENSFVPIKAMLLHLKAKFSFTLRLIQLFNVDRKLRLLFDNEIHRALSLLVGHRIESTFSSDNNNHWEEWEVPSRARNLQVSSSIFQEGAYAGLRRMQVNLLKGAECQRKRAAAVFTGHNRLRTSCGRA
jgi:hypothetical protein